MQPGDDLDPLNENEDPSAEPMDIDEELAKVGQKGDTELGPSPLNSDEDLYRQEITHNQDD